MAAEGFQHGTNLVNLGPFAQRDLAPSYETFRFRKPTSLAELIKILFRDRHREYVKTGRRNCLQFIVFREDSNTVCRAGGFTPCEWSTLRMGNGKSVAAGPSLAPLVYGPVEPAVGDLHLIVAELHQRSSEPTSFKQHEI